MSEIRDAHENDQRLFHKLIRKQRGEERPASILVVDNTVISDGNDIREAWATYFGKLATPSEEFPG